MLLNPFVYFLKLVKAQLFDSMELDKNKKG